MPGAASTRPQGCTSIITPTKSSPTKLPYHALADLPHVRALVQPAVAVLMFPLVDCTRNWLDPCALPDVACDLSAIVLKPHCTHTHDDSDRAAS